MSNHDYFGEWNQAQHEVTAPAERSEPQPTLDAHETRNTSNEQALAARKPSPMVDLALDEALICRVDVDPAKLAHAQELDAKLEAGKINTREALYEARKFDNQLEVKQRTLVKFEDRYPPDLGHNR